MADEVVWGTIVFETGYRFDPDQFIIYLNLKQGSGAQLQETRMIMSIG